MEFFTLNNGVKMPAIGFGVFQIPEDICEKCVLDALEVGYRLIDTAQAYYNEEAVGRAIAKTSVPREEIFLTTKVWVTEYTYEKAKKSVLESMKKLQTDYLDLVLIHQPLSDYYSAWHALEDLYKDKKLRAIGISNFSAERMADLATFNEIVPAVNQVETHLFFQQQFLHEWMEKFKIQHEAWEPLGQHRIGEVTKNPVLMQLAEKYSKTPTQIFLHFNFQRGIISIPKSVKKLRMEENISIFDFELTADEINSIRTFDENKSLWAAYDNPEIVKMAMS